MAELKYGGCINHPGVEAVGRCKQCGKAACSTFAVKGPTGLFCSDECKEKHERFVNRAEYLESRQGGGGAFYKIKKLLISTAILVVLVAAASYVSYVLELDMIPVLPELGQKVAGMFGL